jgi:endonuclease III
LDSVLGAMLTQNVSDVLSSSAIMNLAAKFPGEGATAAPRATAPPEAFFEENDHQMCAATSVSAPPSAETLSVVNETVAALVAGAVETAEAAAASSAAAGSCPGDAERSLAPPVNVEDEIEEGFQSPMPKSPIPPELVSAASGASAFLAAGGVARPLTPAPPPSTPAAAAPPRVVVSPAAIPPPIPSTPPTSPPAPRSGWVPYRKKTKDQIVREERLALAAKALLVPDPSPRPAETRDLINWRAVMRAPLEEVVECIQCRGMHYMLAQRIQRVLRRVEAERNGELSLEFLRDCPTDVARGYLLSMEGYGVKTVSCILLLALYRADFPVDVNVGRIMARLGWVPLETEEALEELSQYAPEPAVYTFLRERLNSFGLQTLFELHYHMITLGKVFCEKRTPNCAACPLRDMCEYASSGGKRQQKENDRNGPEPAPARAAAVPVETAEAEAPAPARATDEHLTRNAAGADDAATFRETPKGVPASDLESVLVAGAAWESGGRPPVGAPAVLLLDPGAGWAEARLAHARLSRAVHPDKCADARAARAVELVTAARNAMAPALPEDDVHSAFAVRDEVVRVDADGEVVVGPRECFGENENERGAGSAAKTTDVHGPEVGDIEDAGGARDARDASRPDKGFARAAAEAAASHAASPLQLRTRPAAMSTTRVRHELIAWSLPADMIPEALRRRAPDVDQDCYLAVRCLLPSAAAAAARAGANAGCEVTPLSVLVPCRAAMYAKFPLHGTYFQTNEVFLDARTAVAPAMVPARRLEFLPTVSVFLGSSVASICRGMSRAEVAAAFAHRAVCVRSWDADGGGRPRPLPKWACPFAPKANTLGPAPGEERAFFGGDVSGKSRAFAVADEDSGGFRFPRSFATRTFSSVETDANAPDDRPVPPRTSPPPVHVDAPFESDEDAMDERWDLFLDAKSDPRGSMSIAVEKNKNAPSGRRLLRRFSSRHAADVDETSVDDVSANPGVGRPAFAATAPLDGERSRGDDASDDGARVTSRVVDPSWNVGVLAAFAARRRAAAAARRKAARDGSGPSGSGSRSPSGSAERRQREPNIQTFFSPAA